MSNENGLIKLKYNGKFYDAKQMDILSTNENWNSYMLEDGTLFKMKTVITKIFRLENEYNEFGEPVYIVQSTNITSTKVDSSNRRTP